MSELVSGNSYWERLQRIVNMATSLQASPVPENERELSLLNREIDAAESVLYLAFRRVSVNCHDDQVWCGKLDDVLRGGRMMAPDIMPE